MLVIARLNQDSKKAFNKLLLQARTWLPGFVSFFLMLKAKFKQYEGRIRIPGWSRQVKKTGPRAAMYLSGKVKS